LIRKAVAQTVKHNDSEKRTGRQAGNKARDGRKDRQTTITPDTPYGECSERLTAFGGLLALVKCLDLIGFEKALAEHYVHPTRQPKMGGYRMVLGIVQSVSLLRLGVVLRSRVWALCGYAPRRVTANIDTTVATVDGAIEGARKRHNANHRGKKGRRRVLCFLDETREYLRETQRREETIRIEEMARQSRQFRRPLPESVREVHVRGDGEFIGWESVNASLDEGFRFTFGNKRRDPPFPKDGWSRHVEYDYNECV